MLKKQTVWLLTMLSLVVVLSVYYITSPEDPSNELVMTGDQKAEEEEAPEGEKEAGEAEGEKEAGEAEGEKEGADKGAEEGAEEGKEDKEGKQPEEEGTKEQSEVNTEELENGGEFSTISDDELFTTLRLELEDSRNRLKEELQAIVVSSEASAAEKSRAYDDMKELSEIANKENVLETLIKSEGYEDALVRADGKDVQITVKAKELSASKANDIIMLVNKEIDDLEDVAVQFDPVE
ncbi:SpoIIIAH-like family protein [Metabacillus arenae]|uniref:SpoIIIAH-like family protein n=1 Tax=Metabacillus arenae TaxID=2771434 RepID=A0A926RUQ4_9BACI|nr:SpoIIIAH-like family protein [Metabacillus arenae]MBD1378798.1 SpoIIIAH-like family protein [Metabacillus arenae]